MSRLNLRKNLALAVFAGITLVYAGLSPGVVANQGYMSGNIRASSQIVANLGSWLTFHHGTEPVMIPRHGLVELVFEIPFILVSRILFGHSPEWDDHLVSLQPVLATSLLCALVFVWVRKITASDAWAYTLALATGFTTIFWPYAYMAMEPTQSLFLFLAGYLALGAETRNTWRRWVAIALCGGVAIGVKANGAALVPAIAFLMIVQLRRTRIASATAGRSYWSKPFVLVAILGMLYGFSAYSRWLSPWHLWWSNVSNFRETMAPAPIMPLNLLSLFGSANKGLLMYCPLTLLALALVPKAYKEDKSATFFAGLVLAFSAIGCSVLIYWSDETWGPRYLHVAIAPLIICLALAIRRIQFRLGARALLAALVSWGLVVGFLGAFFYYGILQGVAAATSPSTLEQLQGDVQWNPVLFHARLFKLWLRSSDAPVQDDDYWPAEPHYWMNDPNRQTPFTPMNIRGLAKPQALLFKNWGARTASSDGILWWLCLASLLSGGGALVWSGYRIRRETHTAPGGEVAQAGAAADQATAPRDAQAAPDAEERGRPS
jgi:hypothetical protein